MKLFLGTDICEIDRIQSLYDKYGEKFLRKTFTDAEISYCTSKPHHTAARLAVRFATKEAVSKGLGVGMNKLGWSRGINWKDVELVRSLNGSVTLQLYGKARELEGKFGITKWEVSVSHSKRDAISTVVGYRE